VHGIVYVKEQLPKPVGASIRGFKSGATSAVRHLLGDPALEVWEDGYHDRVIMNADTLRAERDYIRDNPRRYCVRQAHPDFFVKVDLLESPSLPPGMAWEGFGNRFLLEKPELMPVQVSRRASAHEVAELRAEALDQAQRGTVMVSPFISPGEKEIAVAVMQQDYGSLILFKPEGFPPLYKPSKAYFDLCAQGRLLVVSPFVYTGRTQPFTRERCQQMNEWVREICGTTCGKDAAPRQQRAAIRHGIDTMQLS